MAAYRDALIDPVQAAPIGLRACTAEHAVKATVELVRTCCATLFELGGAASR